MGYPLENLFRKPVEVISAAAALGSCGLLWTHPSFFLVTPESGAIVTVGMFTLAGVRANQARRIIRFQRNLRRLPVYELKAEEIPWSQDELFLGKGFYWEPHHTQRLHMARLTANRHLKARNALYQRARSYERRHPASRLARLTKSRRWWNPVEPLAPVGGDAALHGIEPDEFDVWSALNERVGHTLVLGTTRVGKTRLCELFVTQDIRRGNVVIVFDPKGDVELLLRMYAEAKRAGREKETGVCPGAPGIPRHPRGRSNALDTCAWPQAYRTHLRSGRCAAARHPLAGKLRSPSLWERRHRHRSLREPIRSKSPQSGSSSPRAVKIR